MAPPTVAIVQDHLVQRGGAERVLLSICRALPGAPVHTAFYWPEGCYPEFEDVDVRPLPIDRAGPLRRHHRVSLPALPFAFNNLQISSDVLLCGSSGWAAGAQTDGRKIIYFHSLARWLHERGAYLAGRSRMELAASATLAPWLRRWDRRAVVSGHRHLVYSSAMAAEVQRCYGITAEVLPPPVTIDATGPATAPTGLEPGFVLCPCRLMAYKNVDAVLDAFRLRPGDRLVVAGGGPEEARLRSIAPGNALLLGQVDDSTMRWLYHHCRMVVSAAFEPFGLITLEANTFGKPAAVLGRGGFRDTVLEGLTGQFFDAPVPAEIAATVALVDTMGVDEGARRAHAHRWSEESFVARVRAIVAEESSRGATA